MYKRQVFIEASAAGFTFFLSFMSVHDDRLLAAAVIGVVAVSYTHLDVYKRQVPVQCYCHLAEISPLLYNRL